MDLRRDNIKYGLNKVAKNKGKIYNMGHHKTGL